MSIVQKELQTHEISASNLERSGSPMFVVRESSQNTYLI